MDDYLDSVESPERALIRSKELVHLLHLGGFKLTKFESNVPHLADQIDESAQSSEPNVIVSSKEESMHVLGFKWDHNNDTLVVSRGTNSTITKFNTALGLKSSVKGTRPNWSCRTVYCWCSVNLETHLACQWTKLE